MQALGLAGAELQEERAAGAQEARGAGDGAAQVGRAVVAAVVGERGLEGEGVALEQAELGGRDVGHDADDGVDLAF